MQNTTQTIKNNVQTIVRVSHAPKSLRARAARDAFLACSWTMSTYLNVYQHMILASNFENHDARNAFDRLAKGEVTIRRFAASCDRYVPRDDRMFARLY